MAPWPPWSCGLLGLFWCVSGAPWTLGAVLWDSLSNTLPVCRGGFALCPCGWGLPAASQQIVMVGAHMSALLWELPQHPACPQEDADPPCVYPMLQMLSSSL